ncbi:hypothetical protein RCC89_00045 [Cytophagaceae bacterium ABcell3]|nr:hypothetical protein RCC89_00045 [Cytophagaceae bacterium ABcell3]
MISNLKKSNQPIIPPVKQRGYANKSFKLFIIGLLLPVFLFGTFYLLQKPAIYSNTLGLITLQYINIDGEIKKVDRPYESITNEKLLGWDAWHYYRIKNKVYQHITNTPDEYILAFFPLFPLIWKFSQLPPVGIIILNYIFYLIGYSILFSTFIPPKIPHRLPLFISGLTMPVAVVYFMPYTEGVFMITSAVCFYGIIRKNYPIYFLGSLLLATTRPAITIVALAILSTEVFYFLKHRNIAHVAKESVLKILPLVIGTILVGLLQMHYGSPSITNFAAVQKYWGHHLQVPKGLSDWSSEGYGLNLATLCLFIPWGIYTLLRNIKKAPQDAILTFSKEKNTKDIKNYLLILAIMYQLGTTLYIALFSGGNLHGLFRYLLCTPFFLVILFTWITNKQNTLSFKFLIGAFIMAVVIKLTNNYSSKISFSDLGLLMLFVSITYTLFLHKLKSKGRLLMGATIVAINIVWITFMFNIFLSKGWIFT